MVPQYCLSSVVACSGSRVAWPWVSVARTYQRTRAPGVTAEAGMVAEYVEPDPAAVDAEVG
jgi:hypothetical protein